VHRGLLVVVGSLIVSTSVFAAGPDDPHLTQDSSRSIYADSAFAHGYRHGYEEGFHEADRDLHLSFFTLFTEDRGIRIPKMTCYKSAFGSKDSFRRGFEIGFRYGYVDSARGEDFRMISPELNNLAVSDKDFDRGVQAGFEGHADGCRAGFTAAFCSGVTVGRSMVEAAKGNSQVASARQR
jgi:hypothetical protein